jgi:suppressor of tumorigenicity protein 13
MAEEGIESFPPLSPADVTELTEELEDRQNSLKGEATELLEDGKKEEALAKFTESIQVGCASAMLLCRRAQLLVQLDRPLAAANDCTAALKVNPDSAKAFKIRARVFAKLEKWTEAHADFQTALKIDYDEQTEEDSKEAETKAKELKEKDVKARVDGEKEEYAKKLQESKLAYEAGLKANEEKFREERMKEEEEKKKKEEERKARVNARQASEEKETPADEPGVPKSHGPPAAAPSAAGVEEVD